MVARYYHQLMSNPGTLLHHEEIATGISGASAWRVRYASRDVNGRAHESTGLVIAPATMGSDRPIMTWAHGTTGLGDAACPSAQPDPARELITYFTAEATQQIDYGVPGLQGFIDAGWVVCSTDYQGLGTPGMHHYIVNRSNARDALNIAHAARALPVGAGTTLGCMGWSQGGGTAAAVAELEPDDYRLLAEIDRGGARCTPNGEAASRLLGNLALLEYDGDWWQSHPVIRTLPAYRAALEKVPAAG